MSRPMVQSLLVALLSAACAAAPTPPPAPRAEPLGLAADPCAEFNAREAEAARRHREPGECPRCPCACAGGEIRCAPCARCDPGLERTRVVPAPAKPVPSE